MFLHSHLILAIEDPVKWKYNTKLYREKQKLECEQVWNIVLNTWLSPCLRLWPGPVKCKRNRHLLCYALVLCALNYREDESEKRNPGYICHSKANLIYVSAFTLPSPEIMWKTLEFFLNIKQRVIFFPITF